MCSEAYRRIIVTFGLIPQMVLGNNLTCNALIAYVEFASGMFNQKRCYKSFRSRRYGGTERFLSNAYF